MDLNLDRTDLLVVGNGMVGQRLLQALHDRAAMPDRVVVIGEERWAAYDRVHLSTYMEGATVEDLSLVSAELRSHASIEVRLGARVTRVDAEAKVAELDTGEQLGFAQLVLATGSAAFVPPVPGADLEGSFVYRTIEDLDGMRRRAADRARGVVVGGGLLGLEAARALQVLGLAVSVVELAPSLMPQQLDVRSGGVLRRHIEECGVEVLPDSRIVAVRGGAHGVEAVDLEDGTVLPADIVVFAAGVRPRDEVARLSGLEVGPRGGVAVDSACRTSAQGIWAIGECVSMDGRLFGLVAPGYAMADVVADRLAGGSATFVEGDDATRLKLLGVEVASFGDVHARADGARVVLWDDEARGVVKRVVLDNDGRRVIGGSFVGDATGYLELLQHARDETVISSPSEELLFGQLGGGDASGKGLPTGLVCTCNGVTGAAIAAQVANGSCSTVDEVKCATRAGSTCGSCLPLVRKIVDQELARRGDTVDRSLCEHFSYTRQELADLVRVHGIRTFVELADRFGKGRGCDICRPAVASILASYWNEHVLEREHLTLQDTNDRFLANIQRDGTYSIVPRIPGGEITPDRLIVIGEIARDYDLYLKITGGQRLDLFGARVDQLPEIWGRLIEAGFESGHAYGKALRTVKSCVGSTWCRYGVQDSTALAVELELRYRGLRAPHKIKSAVSGCARECAEAQSKDFGVIATERGWNLYVGGNGGMRPRHAELLVEGVTTEELIRTVDRFLMYYIRSADRLERTAAWIERLDGGIDHVRDIVVHDSIGIAAELEAEMAAVLDKYECEWARTMRDPEAVARFSHFANVDAADPTLAYERVRGQRVPVVADTRATKGKAMEDGVAVVISGRAR